MKLAARILALQLAWSSPVFSQDAPAPEASRAVPAIDYETAHLSRVATAVRITENMTIDGRLDEAGWMLATPVGDFTQRRPRHSEPATERTEVRFLYDDDNLYVGVICFDSDPQIVVNSLQRDYRTAESDGITLLIDSLHDRRSAFTFVTNPRADSSSACSDRSRSLKGSASESGSWRAYSERGRKVSGLADLDAGSIQNGSLRLLACPIGRLHEGSASLGPPCSA